MQNPYARLVGVAPPPAIKVEQPPLDIPALNAAYEWMPVDQIIGFRLAFEWYSANQTALLFGDPLDETRQKRFDKGRKAQLLGDSSNYEGEKIQAWMTAIHTFERVWDNKGLPKIDDALANKEISPRITNIQKVFDNLNQAFADFGVRFRVTTKTEREVTPDGILIPIAEMPSLLTQPPLHVVLNEAPTVAKVKAIVKDPVTGEESLDGDAFFQVLPMVLNRVSQWTMGMNKDAFRPLEKAPKVKVPKGKAAKGSKAPVVPKPVGPRVRIPAIDPFGIFKADTIKAAIAQALGDKKFKTLASLKALCAQYGVTNGMVNTALRELKMKGKIDWEYSPDHKSVRLL
jgi:hypothetical protein